MTARIELEDFPRCEFTMPMDSAWRPGAQCVAMTDHEDLHVIADADQDTITFYRVDVEGRTASKALHADLEKGPPLDDFMAHAMWTIMTIAKNKESR